MSNKSIFKEVSAKLFELFVVDDRKYGIQDPDGKYRRIDQRIDVVTIDDMLMNAKSLLVYQEAHTTSKAFIRWICIDLDIAKKDIEANNVNADNLREVREAAEKVTTILRKENIPFLLEFSGRRGFHIWVIFDELQLKHVGYKLVTYILSKVDLSPIIKADKFPKTPGISKNTKMVGFGVKLPLSQNKVSERLSFFLEDIADFRPDEQNRPSEATPLLLENQLAILRNFRPLTNDELNGLLANYDKQIENGVLPPLPFIRTSSIDIDPSDKSLETIIKSLCKCEHIREILKDYQLGISGKDRAILVGLLGRLRTRNVPNFGYTILIELFSRVKNFKRELTEAKLQLIKDYFPISCAQLGRCAYCKCDPIQSPIMLLDNVEIQPYEERVIKAIDQSAFYRLRTALVNYVKVNDEVPLYHLIKKLERISFNDVEKNVLAAMHGKSLLPSTSYRFDRKENDKVRQLYTLDPLHNMISTYFLTLLNAFFFTEISDSSFGYKVSPSLYNNNIFVNWFVSWTQFSKQITRILTGPEYANHYVIKIDIKNFYDRIDLQRLKLKLYEEAPTNVKLKLNLQAETKKYYLNIIKYLIDLNTNVTQDREVGVPQGPAYARYLAELYLIGLDRVIENELLKDKKREFYYRFVDDIFIFVETQQQAKEVLKAVEMWANTNNLELNKNKTELENVASFNKAGKFQQFEKDVKYFIDKSNKNKTVLTESELQEALAAMDDITDEVKFGLKDNLRFFFYQFPGESRLSFIKDKLLNIIPYTDAGRGSLYMIFYKDLLSTRASAFWTIAKNSARLKGLSLLHFLNTILSIPTIDDVGRQSINNLISSLSNRQDLDDIVKLQIVLLSKKAFAKLDERFGNNLPTQLLNDAMATPEIEYNENDLDYLYKKFEELNLRDFISELNTIISDHPVSSTLASKLSPYVLKRYTEKTREELFNSILTNERDIIRYYQALCFFSLFEKSSDVNSLVQAWANLLEQSPYITLTAPLLFTWLDRMASYEPEDFSHGAYSVLLAAKEGSKLNTFNCPNGFLREFQEALLILLFSKNIPLDDLTGSELELSQGGSKFSNWLKDKNTRLYPTTDDDICLKNLALSGLIVMQNDTHIFIKKIGKPFVHAHMAHLDVEHQYQNQEIEIKKGKTVELYSKLTDFQDLMIKLSNVLTMADKFMGEFRLEYPVFYHPPFISKNFPAIPFYSEGREKISPSGLTQQNNLSAFWENILYIAKTMNPELPLVKDTSVPMISLPTFIEDRFLPKAELIVKTPIDKISFVRKFTSLTKENKIGGIYEYQNLWSCAVWEELIKSRGTSNIIDLLHVHFSNWDQSQDIPYDVFFSVTPDMQLHDGSLAEFMATIQQSLIAFQTQLTEPTDRYSLLIESEKEAVAKILEDSHAITLSDFEKTEVGSKNKFNSELGHDQLKLTIDKKIVDKTILLFDRETSRFYKKEAVEISARLKGSHIFTHEIEDAILIYIPEKELTKAFERIEARKDILHDSAGKYENYFPKKSTYKLAADTYDNFDFSKLEENLSTHYSTATNIRERVISWLTLFSTDIIEESAWNNFLQRKGYNLAKAFRALLQLLTVHYPIKTEAIKYFKQSIKSHVQHGAIIFPLKHPGRDENGLRRLIAKCGFQPRELNWDNWFEELTTTDCSIKELTLLVDTTITGTQFSEALEWYTKKYESDKEVMKEKKGGQRKYFEFKNKMESDNFRANIQKVKKITILTPVLSTIFKEKISNLSIFDQKKLDWQYYEIANPKQLLFRDANIGNEPREIIEALLRDEQLIHKIFEVDNDDPRKKNLTDVDKLNILLRVGSLPLKHIGILSFKPRNGALPLLDYVLNWSKQ